MVIIIIVLIVAIGVAVLIAIVKKRKQNKSFKLGMQKADSVVTEDLSVSSRSMNSMSSMNSLRGKDAINWSNLTNSLKYKQDFDSPERTRHSY